MAATATATPPALHLCPCLNPSPDPATRDQTPRPPQARLSHLFRHHARELTLLSRRFPDLDDNLHNLRYLRTLLNLLWPTAAPDIDRSSRMPEVGLPFRRYKSAVDGGQVDTRDVYLAADRVARGQGHMNHSADAAATVHAIVMIVKMRQEEWVPEGVRRNVEALGLRMDNADEGDDDSTKAKNKKVTLDQLLTMDDLKRQFPNERRRLQSHDLDPFKTSPGIALAALGIQYPRLSFAFDLARRQWTATASTPAITCSAIGFSVFLARSTVLTQLVLLAASGMQPSIWSEVCRGERKVNVVTFLLETFTPPLSLTTVPCTWAPTIVHAPNSAGAKGSKHARDGSVSTSRRRRDERHERERDRGGNASRYRSRSRSRTRHHSDRQRSRSRSRSRSRTRSAHVQGKRDGYDSVHVEMTRPPAGGERDLELRNKLSLGLGGSAGVRSDSHQSMVELYNANEQIMQPPGEQLHGNAVRNAKMMGTGVVGHVQLDQGYQGSGGAVGGASAVTTTTMMMNGQVQQQQMPHMQSIGMGNDFIGVQTGVNNNMSHLLQGLQAAVAQMQAGGPSHINHPITHSMPPPQPQPIAPTPAASALSQMTSALHSIDPSDRASLVLHPLFALWLANPTAAALAHMHSVAPNAATGTGVPTSIQTAHVTQPSAQLAWCAIASVPVTDKARAYGFGLGLVSAIRSGREEAVRACAAKVMLMV